MSDTYYLPCAASSCTYSNCVTDDYQSFFWFAFFWTILLGVLLIILLFIDLIRTRQRMSQVAPVAAVGAAAAVPAAVAVPFSTFFKISLVAFLLGSSWIGLHFISRTYAPAYDDAFLA